MQLTNQEVSRVRLVDLPKLLFGLKLFPTLSFLGGFQCRQLCGEAGEERGICFVSRE